MGALWLARRQVTGCLAGYRFSLIIKRDDASRGLTREKLLALPAAVDLKTANRALSLSRTTGYDLTKRGRYPCVILRFGNAYRVVAAELLKLLHIDVPGRPSIELGALAAITGPDAGDVASALDGHRTQPVALRLLRDRPFPPVLRSGRYHCGIGELGVS